MMPSSYVELSHSHHRSMTALSVVFFFSELVSSMGLYPALDLVWNSEEALEVKKN